MRKGVGAFFLFGLFVLTRAAWGTETPPFRLTPEGAALLKERGSVGYLYWGAYQDC